VSAGSRNTARYGPAERPAAERHIADLHAAAKTAMVQPYLSAVDEHGETGLVFIDGRFSHAIRKGPLLAPGGALVEGLFAPEEITAREPSAAERDEADRVMALIVGRFGPLLYARVDLLAGPDGRPRLLEVELNEPSLFLAQDPASAERLAAAIFARLAVRRS
jgi:hypothetical protein